MIDLSGVPLSAIVAVFLLSGVLVWIAGTRLAIHGDELAERLGLTKEFIGLIFLATVTELPEIITTVTAAQVDNAALVLGNMFGGITMQTAILAVVDFVAVRHALTSWPRKPTHALLAIMLIVLFAGKRWLYAFASLIKPRPSEPPKEWPAWPTWFSGFAFYHNRLFSNLFLLGMLLNLIIRIVFPTFWVMH